MEDENIVFALVFGSHVKPSKQPPADLDLALFFKDPPTGLDLLTLIHELSEFTGKEVDLIVLNNGYYIKNHWKITSLNMRMSELNL